MAVREGAWDCPMCGAKRNRGPHKHCVKCGAKRDPSVEFYLPDDAREVTDEAELKTAEAGPDWTCLNCMSDNSAEARFCGECGRDPSDPMLRKQTVTPEPGVTPAARPSGGGLKIGLGCGFLLLLLALLVFLGRPKEALAQVAGLEWDRVIHLESYGTVTEEAWEGQLPAGARPLTRHRDLHHVNKVPDGYTSRVVTKQVQSGTRKVKTGTKNMGNGYFQDVYKEEPVYKTVQETVHEQRYRDVPIYGIKVTYNVDRWQPSRDLKSAASDANPRWPDFANNPRERERGREDHYRVIFSDAHGRYVYNAPGESQWRSFTPGQSYKIKVSGANVVEIMKS